MVWTFVLWYLNKLFLEKQIKRIKPSAGFVMGGFHYTLKHNLLLLLLQSFYFDPAWEQWKLTYWGFFKCWRCRKSVAITGDALAEDTLFKEQGAG